jgi:hypothetical protein
MTMRRDSKRRYRIRSDRPWGAVAWASALLVATSVAAVAQTAPPGPSADRTWGGCVLDTQEGGTVDNLLADLDAGGIPASNNSGSRQVAFVVVYSISNDNNGQPIGTRDLTGPVICTNRNVVDIVTTEQTRSIPETGGGTVDILNAASAFSLRYRVNNSGLFENRLCHTVDSNADCFRISRTGAN